MHKGKNYAHSGNFEYATHLVELDSVDVTAVVEEGGVPGHGRTWRENINDNDCMAWMRS